MHEYCFYLDFAGWPAEAYAAWAQAVLSAVAIYSAGRLALQQHRREIAQKVGALVALLARAADEVQDLTDGIESHIGSLIVGNWVLERLERISQALRAVPVHELPDDGLVMPLLDAVEYLDRFFETATMCRKATETSVPLSTIDAHRLLARANQVVKCYNAAVEIERKHRPLTRTQKRAISEALAAHHG